MRYHIVNLISSSWRSTGRAPREHTPWLWIILAVIAVILFLTHGLWVGIMYVLQAMSA